MEISSGLVGQTCLPLDIAITPRMVMNYAAAIDDPNPAFLDDERVGGLVAQPMMTAALTWRISAEFERHWGGLGIPASVLERRVHFSEEIEWRRIIVPGDQLRIDGEIKAVAPHRSGTSLVTQYVLRDSTGDVVAMERSTAMLRGVECRGVGVGAECELSRPGSDRIDESSATWTGGIHLDALAAHRYDAGANIYFPIHTSPAYAHRVGLPSIIMQGTATLAMAMREIVDRNLAGNPARIDAVRCNFTDVVRPGTRISLTVFDDRGDIEEPGEVRFMVRNHEGSIAIRDAAVVISQGQERDR